MVSLLQGAPLPPPHPPALSHLFHVCILPLALHMHPPTHVVCTGHVVTVQQQVKISPVSTLFVHAHICLHLCPPTLILVLDQPSGLGPGLPMYI
jgi:hypothetical protein